MREGREFQAVIPDRIAPKPPGREEDHPCAGIPGPCTLEALAIAAGFEKDASDRLHIDAVADPEYHPGQGKFRSLCKEGTYLEGEYVSTVKKTGKAAPSLEDSQEFRAICLDLL
jgi:hypothetical protein